MELYCDARPNTCLGCGGAITTGDVVIPAESGWLLCLDCGIGLLQGRQLAAWPGPEAGREAGAGGPGDGPSEVDTTERREAMQAHPGYRACRACWEV